MCVTEGTVFFFEDKEASQFFFFFKKPKTVIALDKRCESRVR